MLKIRFLRVFNGDSIVISLVSETGSEYTILIDGGIKAAYHEKGKKGKLIDGALKKFIAELKKAKKIVDLLILTHIDDDHIAGILEWFKNDPDAHLLVKEVWFNSGRLIAKYLRKDINPNLDHWIKTKKRKAKNTSIPQGIEFGKYIKSKGIWNQEIVVQGMKAIRAGATFQFLSPNDEKLKALLK